MQGIEIHFFVQDIDECGLTSGICSNGVCENMMGAYQCVCDVGMIWRYSFFYILS